MVYMPAETQGKTWKLSRSFHGQYCVLKVTPTNAEVQLVDRPAEESLFVNLDCVRLCYLEQGNDIWMGPVGHRKTKKNHLHILVAQTLEDPPWLAAKVQ